MRTARMTKKQFFYHSSYDNFFVVRYFHLILIKPLSLVSLLGRQADRQTDRQADRQTDRQVDR